MEPVSPALARSGAASVTATLVAQMQPALFRYFRRKCRNVADAEDLTQDVLMRTIARCRSESPGEIKGYVFRAAVNGWRDKRRRSAIRSIVIGWDDMAVFATDQEITMERVLDGERELQRAVLALQALPARTRDVFLLVRLEHVKQAEVASLFDMSPSAVEKHVAKALVHLTRALAREGGASGEQ